MRRILAAAAALSAALVACSSKPVGDRPRGDQGGSTVSGSCIERYSPDTLKQRDFAFDGTVTAIERGGGEGASDRVTYSVGRWFRGGSGATVTVEAIGLAGITSASDVSATEGARMLVSGEIDGAERMAWLCGFTTAYSAPLAAEWEAALGG